MISLIKEIGGLNLLSTAFTVGNGANTECFVFILLLVFFLVLSLKDFMLSVHNDIHVAIFFGVLVVECLVTY